MADRSQVPRGAVRAARPTPSGLAPGTRQIRASQVGAGVQGAPQRLSPYWVFHGAHRARKASLCCASQDAGSPWRGEGVLCLGRLRRHRLEGPRGLQVLGSRLPAASGGSCVTVHAWNK